MEVERAVLREEEEDSIWGRMDHQEDLLRQHTLEL
jgi:hypothetical protein